ncbi:MAG: hypothetical protein QNJ12_23190 [Ilumatobacter sp.]|uniref:hypothetical protein n=1 Tax=Ilumatobacter sp. TaxID=1967498 RepID=UPI002618F73C|nr:hypothetical protein [Ilumatobacter sp.]MDJ0771711.1 hypothetical protein [Ilumatobacter sp.]
MSDELLDLIDDAFDPGPVPPTLTSVARDAFAWRRADAELATILFDSRTDELVGVRGTATDRTSMRFGTDDGVVRLHLTAATLIVMLDPPRSVVCRIATDDGEGRRSTTEHRTDELGELAIDAPELPLRLEVELPSGTVVTPWVTG